ncbi:hypothetical protein IWX81_002807 [Salinibacterium sp. CAN_S4]
MSSIVRTPYAGPVSPVAWAADDAARRKGRVAIFNATRPDGLDGGWTMDEHIYLLMRAHILRMIDEEADMDGTIGLKHVVEEAQRRYSTHALFPKGRVRNYCTFTKVDLEARCEIERVATSTPQRIMRWRVADPDDGPAQV